MPERRVLITGINGFLGKVLAEALGAEGWEVWGLARTGRPQSRTVPVDLTDLARTRQALASVPRCSTAIHLAALTPGSRRPAGESYTSINTRMTRNFLEATEQMVSHLIFFSSVTVYGEADRRPGPVSVTDPLRPATDYGKSKAACEALVRASKPRRYEILRLAPVYDKEHLAAVAKRVFVPGLSFLKMHLTPSPEHSLCHVGRVVELVAELLRKPSASGGETFHVVDPRSYTQRELADWFPGKGVTVPVVLTRPIYWLAGLLPSQLAYRVRCSYWKLFLSNLYAPGSTVDAAGARTAFSETKT